MSYKVLCWDTSMSDDAKGAANALRFATEDEAQKYASDLYSRWTSLRKYEVATSDEPVNYRFTSCLERLEN